MTRFILGLCVALTACVTNNDPDRPDPEGPDEPVLPKEGVWSYSDTPVSDTCPGGVKTEESGMFAIDAVTAGGFQIIPNDGTEPFSCDLDGNDFDCPDRVKDVEDLRPDIDAVITVRARANGTLSSSTAGTGSQRADATCVGSQCNAAGNVFPCSASVDFTIRAQ